MGMSLCGKGGDTQFNIFSWNRILKLAYWYGWQPMGTEAPDWEEIYGTPIHPDYKHPKHSDWNGTYFSNEGQFVADRDAGNIAAALERAFDDIPDHDCSISVFDAPTAQDISPIEYFSGQGKTRVRDFIEFCRAGGFLID